VVGIDRAVLDGRTLRVGRQAVDVAVRRDRLVARVQGLPDLTSRVDASVATVRSAAGERPKRDPGNPEPACERAHRPWSRFAVARAVKKVTGGLVTGGLGLAGSLSRND